MNSYLEILDSFIDSIAIIDAGGNIIFTNTAWQEFSSHNKGSIIGNGVGVNYLEVCKNVKGSEAEDARKAHDGIRRVISKKEPLFEFEYPCHSPYEKRWFLLRTTSVKNKPEFTLVSHINITGRKLAEMDVTEKNERLKTVNSDLESTLYRIVHDVKAPLNSIRGIINLSKVDNINMNALELMDLIDVNVKKLGDFVEDTLKMSSAELGKTSQNIYFKELMDEIYLSIGHMDGVDKIDFKTSIEQQKGFLSHKEAQRTILVNLITNAVKYRDKDKEKSTCFVLIVCNPEEVIIKIKDNGIGISKDNIGQVFDYRYQANNDISGAGIGLYLVKKVVSELNGSIEVSSELGTGTEFIYRIPSL